MELLEIYIYLFILLFILFVMYLLRNPTEALHPYNLLINSLEEKKVFYSDLEKKQIFKSSELLEKNWKLIRNEYFNLIKNDRTNDYSNNDDNIGSSFIQQDEDFWKGWKTIKLRVFNKDFEDLDRCPVLKEILKDPSIVTAFFSIMEPGKVLPAHYGPFKGILRYHLGIKIPSKELGDCYISVDNQIYEWKDGEGVLFDETHLHFVKNETRENRVILFLDVKRPLSFPLNIINDMLINIMGMTPYNH